MGTAIQFNLAGDKALLRQFLSLERKAQKDIGRKAVRAATAPLVKEFRRVTPTGPTKNLRRSMKRKFKTYQTGVIAGITGSDYNVALHQHLVESGTQPRYQQMVVGGLRNRMSRKSKQRAEARGIRGRYTGVMPASHIYERTWERMSAICNAILEAVLRTKIEEAANG